ncbi:hypothetical protein [Sphingomonas profundi]|uniref:hypothetical protein n=1 Tax=Alterirhizorhabdus profundi TaxID=2681549 RepID=UPI0012E93049|nr:hypothetical protein [Sphingomonas profundi]
MTLADKRNEPAIVDVALLRREQSAFAKRFYYCEPKVRWHGTNCEGVEADLIAKFIEAFGTRPLRNRNTPTDAYERIYSAKELHVLHPGKGGGFHWALTPLPSPHFYRAA